MERLRSARFIIVIFLFFCSYKNVFAQDAHTRDSLFQKLKNAPNDTSKVIALLDYGGQYAYTIPDSSEYFYKQAEVIARREKFYHGLQKYIMYQTEIYDTEGKFDSTILLCREGLNMAIQKHDDYFTAVQLNNTADAFLYQSNHDSAADYYLRAAPIFEKIKDSVNLSVVLSNLAVVFSKMGQYRRAVEYDMQALKISENMKDELGIGYTCSNLGSDYLKLGLYDSAKIYSLRALAIARSTADLSLEVDILINLGLIEDNAANYRRSVEYYNEALDISRQLKSDQNIISCYNGIANTMFKTERYDSSLTLLEQSLPIALAGNFTEQVKDIYSLQYKNYKALNKPALALEAYIKYTDINDSIAGADIQKNISKLEQQYQAASKQKQILQRDLEIQQQNVLLQNKNTWIYILTGIVVLIVALAFLLYKYQQQKQASALNEQKLNELKTAMKVKEEERGRIAAELHDEIGSTLSGISLYSSLALQQLDSDNNTQSKNSVTKIAANVLDTLSRLSDIVWELRPQTETIETIQQKIKRYLAEITKPAHIQMQFKYVNENEITVPGNESLKHIYLVAKEAIHNAVKYAACKNIFVTLEIDAQQLSVLIQDDGNGFDTTAVTDGNGLRNMKKRATDMEASLTIESNENGTAILLQKKLTHLG